MGAISLFLSTLRIPTLTTQCHDGLSPSLFQSRTPHPGNVCFASISRLVISRLVIPQSQVGIFRAAGQHRFFVLGRIHKPPSITSRVRSNSQIDWLCDIFVSEGHGAGNNRIFKFDRTGKLIKQWGRLVTGPGEFDGPHTLAIDSRNRLLVGDRNNNRIQIFDLDGNYIAQMHQFSRPSGIYITMDDIIYVTDSESESVARNHNVWKRGIRWGSLKDGKVLGFIPDPAITAAGTSAAEGVAVDAAGNIYGAEVGPKGVARYVRN